MQSKVKATMWKRFIDDVFSLRDVSHETGNQPVHCVLAKYFYPRIKLAQKENTFLDTTVYKKNDSKNNLFSILRHITSRLKPSNTLMLPLVTRQVPRRVLSRREAIKLLQTNSSKTTFADAESRFIVVVGIG